MKDPLQTAWYPWLVSFADAAPIGTVGATAVRIADASFWITAIAIFTRVDDNGRVLAAGDDDGAAGTAGEAGGERDPGVMVNFLLTGGAKNLVIGGPGQVDGIIFNRVRPLPKPIELEPGSQFQIELTLLKQAAAGTGFDVRGVLEGFHDYSRSV